MVLDLTLYMYAEKPLSSNSERGKMTVSYSGSRSVGIKVNVYQGHPDQFGSKWC
jgi:hypothetical protein